MATFITQPNAPVHKHLKLSAVLGTTSALSCSNIAAEVGPLHPLRACYNDDCGGTYSHLDASDGATSGCDIKEDNWVRHDEKAIGVFGLQRIQH